MTVYYTMKRLEALQEKVGCSTKKKTEDDGVDTSKMSPYEKGQYECARSMKKIRSEMEELGNLDANVSAARKAQLSNGLRKQITSLKKECKGAQTAARAENKKDEYEQLVAHVSKTEQMWKSRNRKDEDDREEDSSERSPLVGRSARKLNNLDGDVEMSEPLLSLHDDEEFQQFFEQTKHNDVKMDQALDRISSGVQRLQTNADMIKDELKVQKHLLDETEEKVGKVHGKLVGVNKKLKDTIKKLDEDKLCIYAICCVLLLGMAGVVYHFAKSDS